MGPGPGAADPGEGIGPASVGFSFGFGCCAWTFSSCCYWGVSPAAHTDFSLLSPLLSQSMDSSAHGASVVGAPGLWSIRAQQLWCEGFAARWRVGSARPRDQTHVPRVGRWILPL